MQMNRLGLVHVVMSGIIIFSIQTGVLAMNQASQPDTEESGCARCWGNCGRCWKSFCSCCREAEDDLVDIGNGVAQIIAEIERFKQEHPEAYEFLLELAEGKPVEQAAFNSFKAEFTKLGIVGADGQVQPEVLGLVNSILLKKQ